MPHGKKIILMIESSRGYGRSLIKGIARYASTFGPWTFYLKRAFYQDTSFRTKSSKSELDHLLGWGAQGIIAREFGPETQEEISSLGIPAVISTVFNQTVKKKFAHIFVRNYEIGKMAAEHLLDKGFRQFAFFGVGDFFWSKERAKGFSDRIHKAGLDAVIYEPPRSSRKIVWDIEQHIVIDWLQSLPKPIGIMAAIDEQALDLAQACKEAQVNIPESVAIISGDNDELLCELANPQLSSVAINAEKAGYEAAFILDCLIKDITVPSMIVDVHPTHVVQRHSTDIFAIPDPLVQEALRYIRNNSYSIVSVDQVARHVALTRQGLNKKFQKFIGRSIHDEIIHYRIQQISKLLADTNYNISQIATALGFSEPKHLTRMFSGIMGMSPMEYRKSLTQSSEA